MRASLRSSALSAFLGLLAASGASAQMTFDPEFEDKGFSGEASVAGTGKTGNTESTDLGLSLKLRHDTPLWRNILGGTYDWGRASGEDTKNRLATSYEIGRLLNERVYAFGRAAYELDEFSGFDSRTILGGGVGVDILTQEARSWSIQAGPAYRVDEVKATFDEAGALLTPAETEQSIAVIAGSRFFSQVNDVVSFRNDTDVTSSPETTTLFNNASLTTELMGAISARFSFEVLHDTRPPPGAEPTDTTSRAALVYSFGK